MAGFILAVDLDLHGKISGCNLFRYINGLVKGLLDSAGDQPGKDKHKNRQKRRGAQNLPAHLGHLLVNVIHINAAADNPVPALDQLYVGNFVNRLGRARLGPFVFDDAGFLFLGNLDHLHKDLLAIGILDIGNILSVQLRLYAMHQHFWFQVIDPEIFVAQVAQILDVLQSPRLCFFHGYFAILGLLEVAFN